MKRLRLGILSYRIQNPRSSVHLSASYQKHFGIEKRNKQFFFNMASYDSKRSSFRSTVSSSSSAESQIRPEYRRQSTISPASPTRTSPRVQLLPRSRTSSYDIPLSPSDIELLENTSFDAQDLSSQDFDFEDVFTYDKPQKKLRSVVEVSSPTRDWSNFSFSHYQPAVSMRQKANRNKSPTTGEMYMKNQSDARRR